MKKLLEVLQYGECDIRFNTDVDVSDPMVIVDIAGAAAMSLANTFPGENKSAVIGVLRALYMADLAISDNKDALANDILTVAKRLEIYMDEAVDDIKQRRCSDTPSTPELPHKE